jgi:hypothetical protein
VPTVPVARQHRRPRALAERLLSSTIVPLPGGAPLAPNPRTSLAPRHLVFPITYQ